MNFEKFQTVFGRRESNSKDEADLVSEKRTSSVREFLVECVSCCPVTLNRGVVILFLQTESRPMERRRGKRLQAVASELRLPRGRVFAGVPIADWESLMTTFCQRLAGQSRHWESMRRCPASETAPPRVVGHIDPDEPNYLQRVSPGSLG